jgi:glutamyl-tRNA synthetase
LSTGPEVIDDFILVKSDGYPTYNFAHIVDDAAMEVTHVIRGQEFISSMPNYLNLYDALGVARPIFATMPHIMAESGNKKLGKRDGAKDALEYLDDGFLPEALVNFIATLGWNDGTEQEIFTMEELIEKFSLDRVGRSGARFDVQRLTWLNGQHIRTLTLDDLYSRVEKFWPTSAANASQSYKKEILKLVQDRLKTLQDLPSLSSYFFEEPTIDWSLVDSNKQLKKLGKGDIFKLLETAEHELSRIENWNAENIQTTLNDLLEITGQKPGILFSLIRIATTWAPFSPQLNETLELLGKETVIRRVQQSLDGNQ